MRDDAGVEGSYGEPRTSDLPPVPYNRRPFPSFMPADAKAAEKAQLLTRWRLTIDAVERAERRPSIWHSPGYSTSS